MSKFGLLPSPKHAKNATFRMDNQARRKDESSSPQGQIKLAAKLIKLPSAIFASFDRGTSDRVRKEAVMQPYESRPPQPATLNHSASIGPGGWAMSYLRDFNMAAFWAGITGFVWYAFGTVPLHVAVSDQLGLTTAQSSSWMFIVWFSGAVASIGLSLRYRQPIPITWTIPGLVYLGTLAGQYTIAEIVGANLVAGALIIALGLMGVGARMMAWLPLPIVMGMFAGSILGYVTRMTSATVSDVASAGVTVAAFLVGRAIRNPKVPPLGLALIAGGVAVYVTGTFASTPIQWALPTIAVAEITFSAPAIIAITLPMLILAMGLGNVQGIGFLLAQGYRVPVDLSTVIVGVSSVVNASFGGHPATVARTGAAIFAAPDAGPQSGRYWANLVAASLTILLAVTAAPVMSLVGVLPRSYVFALAGLAVLSALQDALEKSFGSTLRFAALIAFGVSATPFSIAGITSAFWAIVAGLLVALSVERSELLAFWRGPTTALKHDPEKCAAVFGKDHAQTRS